ncbi:MAG: DNA-directed RNA polymerase subunit D [Candidatus Hodarchaeota archaeon]
MEFEVLEQRENYLRFVIRGITPAAANALRRVALSEVPTMAIDDVIFIDNSSVMFDEQISHRLAMLPIRTDLSAYSLTENCTCDGQGCTGCEVSFTLEKEATAELETVYSGDLVSQDPAIGAVVDNVPLLELSRGQKILVEAIARLGLGRDHAKFQPVSSIGYKYLPRVIVVPENCTLCWDCTKVCPVNIIKEGDTAVKVIDMDKCILCSQCEDICEVDAIRIDLKEDEFLFNLESSGSLTPRQILVEAINILKKKAEELTAKIRELE